MESESNPPFSASDPRALAAMRLLPPREVAIRIDECCENFEIPYVYEDPNGSRARAFGSIIHSLSVAWWPRALMSILIFIEEYGRFSPDEILELVSIDEDRDDELSEHVESIRQSHVMIQYDSMALRLPNLSDAMRTTITTRIKGTEATLAHDMDSFNHMCRGLGIIGAIILDQKSAFFQLFFGSKRPSLTSPSYFFISIYKY